MTYIVEVEKNYDAFQRCMKSVQIPRWDHIKTPMEYYQELANFIGNYYNFKCHLYKSNLTRDKMIVFDELEFPSEQEYVLWLLKFG